MFKAGELLKRKFRRYVVPAVALVVLAAITIVVCAAVSKKEVYVHDGENVTVIKTGKLTVGEALEEAEIIPGAFDVVNPSPDSRIEVGMEIHITRAIPLTLIDGGEPREVFTQAKTVGMLLESEGITLSEFDGVLPAPETAVFAGMTVEVKRSKVIEYYGDGGYLSVHTQANTVGEMLTGLGVKIGESDFTEPGQDAILKDGLMVRLIRVTKKNVKNTVTVGYKIEEKTTSSLVKGKTRIAQNGKNGITTETYEVTFHDGVEVDKTLVSSVVTRKPVNKIIEKGTAEKPKSTSSAQSSGNGGTKSTAKGENFSYKKMIVCRATAYDLSYESCGKNPGDSYYGITASGMKAGYGVVAVDPSVIPLGTKLYIEAADGSWAYGYCVAGDTGTGIYGNRVDLFFNTRQEVKNFGIRNVNVYIL